MQVFLRLHSRWTMLVFTLFVLAGSVMVVYAGATFGTVVEPAFNGTDYVGSTQVTAISNPDKLVCIQYRVNGGTATNTPCSCTAPGCTAATSIGTWVCTIPGPILNATVNWRMGTWTAGGGNSCGSEKTVAATGSFQTSATAVTLSALQSSEMSGSMAAAVASLLLFLTGIILLRRRAAA